ncbi:Short chain dehydrogenase citE [Lachnellula suecica]|uniref:Short chain dehydrogenase citE n=1 Tax=Lachnellula suecica TaxID=602035 RepID=A0A8T9CDT4_9HELO|nr:Short chain dehydrogenase citE [Lachnellula suecica]
MKPPFPSATPTWHNDTYASISPSRPEISSAGKTVVIIGAGSGIGRETALAFASAGASKIVLLGRKEASLLETKAALPSTTTSLVHAVSITDEKTMKEVAASVGTWDILIIGSAYVSSPSAVADSSIDDWWKSYETNVKGPMIAAKLFLPTANPKHATILGLTTGTAGLPVFMLAGLSAYSSSKLALVKFFEFLAAENPNVFVATLHPGMIETDIFKASGAKAEALPMDTVQLPAHFMVWLSSPEAAFLKGRLVWANWDVDELKSQTQEIVSGLNMTSGIVGWPYPNM